MFKLHSSIWCLGATSLREKVEKHGMYLIFSKHFFTLSHHYYKLVLEKSTRGFFSDNPFFIFICHKNLYGICQHSVPALGWQRETGPGGPLVAVLVFGAAPGQVSCMPRVRARASPAPSACPAPAEILQHPSSLIAVRAVRTACYCRTYGTYLEGRLWVHVPHGLTKNAANIWKESRLRLGCLLCILEFLRVEPRSCFNLGSRCWFGHWSCQKKTRICRLRVRDGWKTKGKDLQAGTWAVRKPSVPYGCVSAHGQTDQQESLLGFLHTSWIQPAAPVKATEVWDAACGSLPKRLRRRLN